MAHTPSNDQLPVSGKVIAEVADREDVPPTELDPLHSVVDPTALDDLFRPVGETPRRSGHVCFSYSGYEITIYADGFVSITP